MGKKRDFIAAFWHYKEGTWIDWLSNSSSVKI